uniref:Uncharacterized protein n=1 Tax=Anguilla anguilla TaxID=7936 RepID=A0A0E9UYS1_ANGAN
MFVGGGVVQAATPGGTTPNKITG